MTPTPGPPEEIKHIDSQSRDSIEGAVVSLRDYFNTKVDALYDRIHELDTRHSQRFDAQEKAVGMALYSAEKAVSKAETATEKRFDSVNEFRAALGDQGTKMVPRTEYEARHTALAEKISSLELRVSSSDGRGSGSTTTQAAMLAIIGTILAAATLMVVFLRGHV